MGFIDAFKQAHDIKSLAGELPTQDLAILRVMLAALYAIYLRKDAEGIERPIGDVDDAIDRWNNIWVKGRFEPTLIDSYLRQYEGRFYLFHPDRPFFQAKISKGTNYSAAKLNSVISESGNKIRLFAPLNNINKTQISYAEATRWLIHAVAFDDASAKQKDKSNGSVQMSTGWLGQIGPVYAEGDNLFETLMLNFVLVSNDAVMSDGHPIWEEDRIRTGERTVMPVPKSPAELLTMQSRRILLTTKDGKVDGYNVIGGDIVSPINAHIEQMTSWRNNKDKNGWAPKRLREDVSMWRDYSSLLLRSEKNSETIRIPGVVEWLRELFENELIPYGSIRLRTTGVIYGNMFSSIQSVIDDNLSINAGLLSELSDVWNLRISQAIETIDEGVKHIGTLQANLLECEGFKNDDANLKERREYAKSEAYFRIDQPFRIWLASVNPETDDMEEDLCRLYDAARNIILHMGNEMMENINNSAMAGREKSLPSDNGKFRINAFRSYSKFEKNIYETFRSVT